MWSSLHGVNVRTKKGRSLQTALFAGLRLEGVKEPCSDGPRVMLREVAGGATSKEIHGISCPHVAAEHLECEILVDLKFVEHI